MPHTTHRTAWHHLVSYPAPAPLEAIVVSPAQTDNDIATTLQAADEA
jgi:glutamate-1-semialdehyde aminotransferase